LRWIAESIATGVGLERGWGGHEAEDCLAMDRHDTIGQDLVNHCVNDIAVLGAEPPLFWTTSELASFSLMCSPKSSKVLSKPAPKTIAR